jgi:hypothetical protein
MHPGKTSHDLEMAQLLGANIHQQIFAVRVLAIEALDRILHGGGKLAVGTSELLQEHVSKAGIRLIDPDGVHELLDVMIHGGPPGIAMGYDSATGSANECSAPGSIDKPDGGPALHSIEK